MKVQAEDVVFAEKRLMVENQHGVLFGNGTGTGKTFTGLGIAKRSQLRGNDSILIVVPSAKIATDWVRSGRMVDLPLKKLKNKKDNGASGGVVTTYANFRDNPALAQREWDMVVMDEAQHLLQADTFDSTASLDTLRALTGYPGSESILADKLDPERRARLDELTEKLDNATQASYGDMPAASPSASARRRRCRKSATACSRSAQRT